LTEIQIAFGLLVNYADLSFLSIESVFVGGSHLRSCCIGKGLEYVSTELGSRELRALRFHCQWEVRKCVCTRTLG